ncbi:5417_t:CDS:2 [Dentiscutata erythropus]|uniref:Mitochondrial inner membrane protease subunit 2 n=1 Tax=Dentiscutata erythropus TaxID=1348616 RepID=A0A9N9DE07_9GLOM|nr:5417_t:CDS:2 [Dentiscutata erythropus]
MSPRPFNLNMKKLPIRIWPTKISTCVGIASWIPVIIWSLDHGYTISSVSGRSMQPTFNPDSNKLTRDIVLLNRQAAISHKYKRGDVILNGFSAPDDPDKVITKRIIALEGDTVFTLPPYPDKFLRIPNGHCWVEGDDVYHSKDSNTFGPVPLGLINAKVTYILWPLPRFGKVPHIEKPGRVAIYAESSAF